MALFGLWLRLIANKHHLVVDIKLQRARDLDRRFTVEKFKTLYGENGVRSLDDEQHIR